MGGCETGRNRDILMKRCIGKEKIVEDSDDTKRFRPLKRPPSSRDGDLD